MGRATRNPSIVPITDGNGDAFTHPCMIKINKILLKDQVSFNRLLGGRPILRTGY
jgi:hypothetical protein